VAREFTDNGISLRGQTVAVQEYGIPGEDFYNWLKEQGAEVIPVPVYRWDLPEDVSELERTVRGIIQGEYDILLWTSAQQVVHVRMIAEQMGIVDEWTRAANRCVIGSIGPAAS